LALRLCIQKFRSGAATGLRLLTLDSGARPSGRPGTEFLDAETNAPKIATFNARTSAETKIREMSGLQSRRNALFGVVSETCGLRIYWMVETVGHNN